MNSTELASYIKLFEYYRKLGRKALDQVEPEKYNWEANVKSNSIATIVKHLHGNMRSRWTDFLTTDGEKDFRNRDQEFENDLKPDEVIEVYEAGWQVVFDALSPITEQQMDTIVYIRNEGHSIMEAVSRQLGHYSYHIGQIVFIARLLSENWESLSIPAGASKKYNENKFSKQKSTQFFTDKVDDK